MRIFISPSLFFLSVLNPPNSGTQGIMMVQTFMLKIIYTIESRFVCCSNFPFPELLQSFILPFLFFFLFLLPSTIFLHFFLFLNVPPPNLDFLSYIFVYLLIPKHTLSMLYDELSLQQALLQVSSSFLVLFPLYLSFHCIFCCERIILVLFFA